MSINTESIIARTEVRRHNGQCAYGDWMPLADQCNSLQEVVLTEIIESQFADSEPAEQINHGGQIYVIRQRSTRTIIAVTDAHCWSLENVPAERIVELMYEAGEAYYANRDDVGSFEVIERLERYSNVDLPADYNKAESKAIMAAAWELYCNGPAQG